MEQRMGVSLSEGSWLLRVTYGGVTGLLKVLCAQSEGRASPGVGRAEPGA